MDENEPIGDMFTRFTNILNVLKKSWKSIFYFRKCKKNS